MDVFVGGGSGVCVGGGCVGCAQAESKMVAASPSTIVLFILHLHL
jgi:hypothetical protein